MLLVFDIGNTQIKTGVFDGETLVGNWRMTTAARKTNDEYGIDIIMILRRNGIQPEQIDRVIVSTVVPNIMYAFNGAIRRYLKLEPIQVSPEIKTGIEVKTENPKEIGADLLTDAAAAYLLYGGPCIVVDFGTATKFINITEKGELIGAVICPGVGISAEALVNSAAQLPSVAIEKPDSILTSNTVKCIQAGLVYGNIGQVEFIVARIKRELGLENVNVIATGGFGSIIGTEAPSVNVYDPLLTLKGLRILAEMNS